jgi:RNA polymerase sigma-70 factor (ECF subfamily)
VPRRAAPAQAGDVSAVVRLGPEGFRAFYDTALPEVYGYLLVRCGRDRTLAEDLTQEVFLVAARAVREGDTSLVSVPYLIGVARNKLVDHVRRAEREQRSLRAVADLFEEAYDQHPDPAYDRGAALAALDRVAPTQRLALVLRYFDELSVPEVAARLGRSVHATESLLARGREAFRRSYREAGDE